MPRRSQHNMPHLNQPSSSTTINNREETMGRANSNKDRTTTRPA
ncbi:unnamed protein product [Rhodiola kirilowii]